MSFRPYSYRSTEPSAQRWEASSAEATPTNDGSTATRHPDLKRGKWHSIPHANQWITRCGVRIPEGPAWLELPLKEIWPEDRCKKCWPTTKETR